MNEIGTKTRILDKACHKCLISNTVRGMKIFAHVRLHICHSKSSPLNPMHLYTVLTAFANLSFPVRIQGLCVNIIA